MMQNCLLNGLVNDENVNKVRKRHVDLFDVVNYYFENIHVNMFVVTVTPGRLLSFYAAYNILDEWMEKLFQW